jgi:hypothetical protein
MSAKSQNDFYLDRARELTEFCVHNRGRCFKDWPVRTLYAYCFFLLVDRGLFCIRANGSVAAVMFAWGSTVDDIRGRAARKDPAFDWKRSNDRGDAIFLAEVIGDRNRLPKLFKLATARWPDWQNKQIFTYRGSDLVELPHELIKRMIYGCERVSQDLARTSVSVSSPSSEEPKMNIAKESNGRLTS